MVSVDIWGEGVPERQPIDRREVRIHCRVTVQFIYSGMLNYGVCWNLGLHGMYIAYEGDIAQGEPIELSFVVSDEYPSLVEATGKVVWTNTGEGHRMTQMPEGFGVEFQELPDESRVVIHRFIEAS